MSLLKTKGARWKFSRMGDKEARMVEGHLWMQQAVEHCKIYLNIWVSTAFVVFIEGRFIAALILISSSSERHTFCILHYACTPFKIFATFKVLWRLIRKPWKSHKTFCCLKPSPFVLPGQTVILVVAQDRNRIFLFRRKKHYGEKHQDYNLDRYCFEFVRFTALESKRRYQKKKIWLKISSRYPSQQNKLFLIHYSRFLIPGDPMIIDTVALLAWRHLSHDHLQNYA